MPACQFLCCALQEYSAVIEPGEFVGFCQCFEAFFQLLAAGDVDDDLGNAGWHGCLFVLDRRDPPFEPLQAAWSVLRVAVAVAGR